MNPILSIDMGKVFGIGFHKTGTTTLHVVLKELGYNVCSHRVDLASDLMLGDLTRVFQVVDQYDAFEDNPWPILFKELDKYCPGSKFIVTCRDKNRWWNSILNHFGSRSNLMREWIYGEGAPKDHMEIYLTRYERHYKEVKEYFYNRPEDVLYVDWEKGDGYKEVCAFLRVPIPNKPFPHANKAKYSAGSKFINRLKSTIYKKIIKPFRLNG